MEMGSQGGRANNGSQWGRAEMFKVGVGRQGMSREEGRFGAKGRRGRQRRHREEGAGGYV